MGKLYAVVVESSEARSGSPGEPIMTKEGEKFIVVNQPEGWVEADSRHWSGKVPADAKVFKTPEAAEKFAKRWKGHPWWVKPNGNFEVIEVEPVFESKFAGYKKS